ncbi:MAG: AarF/UbiB family protein, partial [Vibrionaceae bacterium]
MTPTEIRRFYRIVRVLLEYGVDALLPESVTQSQFFYPRRALFWLKNSHHEKAPGERLRLALQELGPVWIKFGQMLSTRRDLFPAEIADQLALLQDKVAPFSCELARAQIEQALGGKLEQWFADFDPKPLASASIAQVHTATLLSSQQQVVIKVLRPDIEAIIAQDVKLMFRLARMLVRLVPQTQRLRPVEV